MNHHYSKEEMADIHYTYGRADGNSALARRYYAERYPDRALPSHSLFARLHQRIRETGSVLPGAGDRGNQRTVRTPELEQRVLETVGRDPGVSVRTIAAAEGISHSIIWEILHEQLLYPYHIQRVQKLSAHDYPARRQFCEWLIQKCTENRNFPTDILFTDEAGFTKDGIFNYHNEHQWADENPHAVFETKDQHRFAINVWAGILGDRLIGPVVLPNRLNGLDYHNFLVNDLPRLLEDVPLIQRQRMWYMQDGAPPHYLQIVRAHLNQTYGENWIGRQGPIAWPPRSPDLNPLDFFLWGFLKTKVYSTPINDVAELQQRVLNVCDEIRVIPGIFGRVRFNLRRRARICFENDGGHVEHLL